MKERKWRSTSVTIGKQTRTWRWKCTAKAAKAAAAAPPVPEAGAPGDPEAALILQGEDPEVALLQDTRDVGRPQCPVAEITAHLSFALISNEAIADMATDVNFPTQRVMECGTYAETEGEAPPHEGIAAPREENTAEVAPQKEKLDHSAVNALSSELISARLTAIGKLVNSQNQEKILDLFILKSIWFASSKQW